MTSGADLAHSASLPVLAQSALNRATLARQLLLARSALDPVEAAGAVGGLQAQEPASPYVALWSRLEAFDADAMSAAFADRRLVKGGLMRATLHAVPAGDYLLLRPAVDAVFSVSSRLMRGVRPPAGRLAELRAEVERMAATPRPASELRDAIAAYAGIDDEEGRDALWWWVRRTTPFLQAPTGGAWSFGRRPSLVAPEAWLGRRLASAEAGSVHLVRRYLAALGPATARRCRVLVQAPGGGAPPRDRGARGGRGAVARHGRAGRRAARPRGRAAAPGGRRGAAPIAPDVGRAPARARGPDPRHRPGAPVPDRRGQRRHLPDLPRRRPRGRPVVDAGHGERTRRSSSSRSGGSAPRTAPGSNPRPTGSPDSSPTASRPPMPGTASAGIARLPARPPGPLPRRDRYDLLVARARTTPEDL